MDQLRRELVVVPEVPVVAEVRKVVVVVETALCGQRVPELEVEADVQDARLEEVQEVRESSERR